jgi:hypothetical protein
VVFAHQNDGQSGCDATGFQGDDALGDVSAQLSRQGNAINNLA